ncbi:MAG: nitroreductase [Parvularculaceae bacterium]|nr:nitroreductase [Parvularculaceae bacterium]
MTSVSEAVERRRSCRAFRPDALSKDVVQDLIERSLRSPSGGNVQPWRIIAVAGEEKDALTRMAQAELFSNPKGDDDGYPIYPPGLQEPFRSRRYQVGEDLYAALGVAREDRPARYAWVANNFSFFGAPVGLFFVTRKSFGHGQWAHLGMLMQTITLLAEEQGLGSCMQEAWAVVRKPLHTQFNLDADEVVYAGLALGHPDVDAPVNQWRSRRASVAEIAEFRGF